MQLSRTLFNTADVVYCKLIIYSKPPVRGSFHPQLAFCGSGAVTVEDVSVLDCAKALEDFAGQPAKSVGGAGAGRELEDRLRRSRRLFERAAGENLGVEDVVAGTAPAAVRGSRTPRAATDRPSSTGCRAAGCGCSSRTRTFSTDASRLTSPSTARCCGVTGTISASAATSALTPMSDRFGGQSRMITSY